MFSQSATTILQDAQIIHDGVVKQLDQYIDDMDPKAAQELLTESQQYA